MNSKPVFAAAILCAALSSSAAVSDAVDAILGSAAPARYLLVGDGPLADALLERAPEAAPDLCVVPLRAPDDPAALEAFRLRAERDAPSKRAADAAELGPVPFLVAWLLDAPESAAEAFALADAPAAPSLAPGFDSAPSGAVWRPAPVGKAPADADRAAFDDIRDRLGEALADAADGADAALAGAVRRHFSRVANDFGRRLALAGDAAAARDAFDSAAAFFPGAPSALLNLASLERIAPHADTAIRAKLAAALQGLRPSGGVVAAESGVLLKPQDFFDAGWFWTVSGLPAADTNAVAEAFSALPSSAPREALAGLARVSFAIQRGNADAAVAFLLRNLPDASSRLSPGARLAAAGLLCDTAGDFRRAAALLARFAAPGGGGVPAEETAGGDAPFWLRAAAGAADALARGGDAEGVEALEAAVAKAASAGAASLAGAARAAFGPAYVELARWDAAAKAFAAAPDGAPLAEAAAALARGDALRAAEALKPLAADPDAPWPVFRTALEAAIRRGDRDAASGFAEALLRLRPRDAFAHWALGSVAAQRGDKDAALRHLQTSVASRPTWLALNDLASLLVETGNPAQGEKFARMAVAAAGDSVPTLRETLGEALQALGRTAEAAREFRLALDTADRIGMPAGPHLPLCLAETLLQSGDAAGAAALLPRIDREKDALSVADRTRLGALRKALAP